MNSQKVFNLKHAMAKLNLTGAPGTKEVAKQLARWREVLQGYLIPRRVSVRP